MLSKGWSLRIFLNHPGNFCVYCLSEVTPDTTLDEAPTTATQRGVFLLTWVLLPEPGEREFKRESCLFDVGIFPRTHAKRVKFSTLLRMSSTRSEVKWLSRVRLFVTPWTVAYQAPPWDFQARVLEFGVPPPSPGGLPDPGIEPGFPHCRQMLDRLSWGWKGMPRIWESGQRCYGPLYSLFLFLNSPSPVPIIKIEFHTSCSLFFLFQPSN